MLQKAVYSHYKLKSGRFTAKSTPLVPLHCEINGVIAKIALRKIFNRSRNRCHALEM